MILALNRAFVWVPFQGELGKLWGAFSFCSDRAQVLKEAQCIERDNGVLLGHDCAPFSALHQKSKNGTNIQTLTPD